jgi:hypothetical protein
MNLFRDKKGTLLMLSVYSLDARESPEVAYCLELLARSARCFENPSELSGFKRGGAIIICAGFYGVEPALHLGVAANHDN